MSVHSCIVTCTLICSKYLSIVNIFAPSLMCIYREVYRVRWYVLNDVCLLEIVQFTHSGPPSSYTFEYLWTETHFSPSFYDLLGENRAIRQVLLLMDEWILAEQPTVQMIHCGGTIRNYSREGFEVNGWLDPPTHRSTKLRSTEWRWLYLINKNIHRMQTSTKISRPQIFFIKHLYGYGKNKNCTSR